MYEIPSRRVHFVRPHGTGKGMLGGWIFGRMGEILPSRRVRFARPHGTGMQEMRCSMLAARFSGTLKCKQHPTMRHNGNRIKKAEVNV
jgi:hypothetical protein